MTQLDDGALSVELSLTDRFRVNEVEFAELFSDQLFSVESKLLMTAVVVYSGDSFEMLLIEESM